MVKNFTCSYSQKKNSKSVSAIEFEKFFIGHTVIMNLLRLRIHGKHLWIVWWLVLCINLTGHGVPRLNIILGYVCDACYWMRLAFESADSVKYINRPSVGQQELNRWASGEGGTFLWDLALNTCITVIWNNHPGQCWFRIVWFIKCFAHVWSCLT